MKQHQGTYGLMLMALTATLGTAVDARGGQAADRPLIEAGVRAVGLAQPDNPGAGGGAVVTWNLDGRTAIEASADFRPRVSRPSSSVSTEMGYVHLKRTLFASGNGRFYGMLGAAGGRKRQEYSGYSYTISGKTYTYPGWSYRKTLGGLSLGIGYDRVLSRHIAFDVQMQFVITQDRPILRTVLGLSVPIGHFAPRHERATPTLATFSEVEVGQTAWVTMADGRLWKGSIAGMSTTTVDLVRAGVTTSLPLADVRKIEAPDRITDGAKRGAYIGLSMGIPMGVLGAALCESGDNCAGFVIAATAFWSGVGAGMGALIGALTDSLHEGRRVVYDAGKTSLSVTPIVTRRGAGVGAVIRW